jgi:hypothetical protein
MMNGIQGETTHPGSQGRGIGPTTDRLADGQTGVVERAFEVPSLFSIKSLPSFASRWHRLHPDHPLVPLRRAEAGRKGCEPPPTRTGWVPLDGRWDDPPAGNELARVLKADPKLGVGLRLGRRGPGMPWLIDILARNIVESRSALRRMLKDSLWRGDVARRGRHPPDLRRRRSPGGLRAGRHRGLPGERRPSRISGARDPARLGRSGDLPGRPPADNPRQWQAPPGMLWRSIPPPPRGIL